MRDLSAWIDMDYALRPNHQVRTGANVVLHWFEPSITRTASSETSSETGTTIQSTEVALYAEDGIGLGPDWHASVGLRASAYLVEEARHAALEPRLLLRYMATSRTSVEASVSAASQYVHLLSRSGIGIPLDLWLPATSRVPAERAWQVSLGAVRALDWSIELSVEAYWKTMSGLVHPLEGGFFLGSGAGRWEERVVSGGEGRAYGIEMLLRRHQGRLSGWIAYSLARSTRRFGDIDGGQTFPYRFDRLHDLALTASFRMNPKWEFQTTFVVATGNAVWLPVARAPAVEDMPGYPTRPTPDVTLNSYIYGPMNRSREPPYHRLDLAFRHTTATSWGRRAWTLGVYNAYAHRNPFFIYATSDDDGRLRYRRVSPFILIPAISLSFEL